MDQLALLGYLIIVEFDYHIFDIHVCIQKVWYLTYPKLWLNLLYKTRVRFSIHVELFKLEI